MLVRYYSRESDALLKLYPTCPAPIPHSSSSSSSHREFGCQKCAKIVTNFNERKRARAPLSGRPTSGRTPPPPPRRRCRCTRMCVYDKGGVVWIPRRSCLWSRPINLCTRERLQIAPPVWFAAKMVVKLRPLRCGFRLSVQIFLLARPADRESTEFKREQRERES